jgi:hypothetical protein
VALKLSAREKVYETHLEDILRSYSFCVKNWSLEETYYASPRVVDNRFLLFSKHTTRSLRGPLSISTLPIIGVCPHSTLHPDGGRSHSPFLQCASMLSRGEKASCDSCNRCPTDYAIEFTTDFTEVSISAWKDFGSPISPLDMSWTIHLETWDNTPVSGPSMPCAPGRCRELYQLGGRDHT